jgi:hypothetical protein
MTVGDAARGARGPAQITAQIQPQRPMIAASSCVQPFAIPTPRKVCSSGELHHHDEIEWRFADHVSGSHADQLLRGVARKLCGLDFGDDAFDVVFFRPAEQSVPDA